MTWNFSDINWAQHYGASPESYLHRDAGPDNYSAGFYLTGVQNLASSWDGRDGESNFENARAGSSMEYTILRYGANFMLMPGGDWRLRAVVNGQYTENALVAGEQYGIGERTRSAASGAGVRQRLRVFGSLEVYSPDLFRLVGVSALQSRLLVFLTAARSGATSRWQVKRSALRWRASVPGCA